MEGKSDILDVLHQNKSYFMRESSINLVAMTAGKVRSQLNHNTNVLESFTV